MTYFLVQDDTSSAIKAYLTSNDTGEALPLTPDDTVLLKVRARNTSVVLFTVTGQGTTQELLGGIVTFPFSNNLVGLPEGYYEGEVEITYLAGGVETVYETPVFKVRADF